MDVCSLCKKTYDRANIDRLDNGAPICPECASRFDIVMISEDPAMVKEAAEYLCSCAANAEDPAIKKCIRSFIKQCAPHVELPETDGVMRDVGQKADKTADKLSSAAAEAAELVEDAQPAVGSRSFGYCALGIAAAGVLSGVLASLGKQHWPKTFFPISCVSIVVAAVVYIAGRLTGKMKR